jgi:hypothetical protein
MTIQTLHQVKKQQSLIFTQRAYPTENNKPQTYKSHMKQNRVVILHSLDRDVTMVILIFKIISKTV